MRSWRIFVGVLLLLAGITSGASEHVPAEPQPVEADPVESGPAETPSAVEPMPALPEEIEALSTPKPADMPPKSASPQDFGEPTPLPPDFVGPPQPPRGTPGQETPRTSGADEPFVILGQALEPGKLRQFNWQLETAVAGLAVPTPVLVAHGLKPGPTLCLVAAVHGDELNGVEIVRRIIFDIDLEKLAGNVVGVPIANAFGFLRSSRYLPDRRDLNRYFPGDAQGSMASRFAHSLFTEVISRCDVLVDLHTGSFYRTNLPQLRADLTIASVLDLSRQFGDIAVLHSVGPSGSLRRAATDADIPAVTMETGGPARFQEGAVNAGVRAIEALLNHLGMVKRFRLFGEPQPVIYESAWVRAETGGILLGEVSLGDIVEKGQRLGTVTDPIQNTRETLEAPFRGRLLGMAVNQVVMPGFAAFHLGRAADEREAIESTALGGDQVESEYLEDAGVYGDEDELFDPPAPDTDEPEPELPVERRTAPRAGRVGDSAAPQRVERHVRTSKHIRSAAGSALPGEAAAASPGLPSLPDLRWLDAAESGGDSACLVPPSIACPGDGG